MTRTKGHELVKPVYDENRGLPTRCSELFGKSDVWWRSFGYPSRNEDPLSNGNLSPVDHFLKFVDQFEAAQPGAGKRLAELVRAELRQRYGLENGESGGDHTAFLIRFNKEHGEAFAELLKGDVKKKTRRELQIFEKELIDLETVVAELRAKTRAELRLRDIRPSIVG